jgi:DNA-binding IscR family transcriptional regulator
MVPARFAVATHILLLLTGTPREDAPAAGQSATSFWLAERVHTNPVVVRRISGQLARAGLVRVRRGAGGAALARPAAAITLEDVWIAVNGAAERPLLPLPPLTRHSDAGLRVRTAMEAAFAEAEAAFRGGLRGITLDRLATRVNGAEGGIKESES